MAIGQSLQMALFGALERLLPQRWVDFLKIARMAALHPCQIHVGIPGDLKRAVAGQEGEQLLADLRRGLDEASLAVLDRLLARLAFFPDIAEGYAFLVYSETMLEPRERAEISRWRGLQVACRESFRLPRRHFSPEAFLHHHGMKLLPPACQAYIAGKDFLDLGAFVGDSALVLRQYRPHRIYAFEVSPTIGRQFRRTMRRNRVGAEEVELIMAGVSDAPGRIRFQDTGMGDTTLGRCGSAEVEVTTVDAFVERRRLVVGLVKMDIEGMGLKAVCGMEQTLRKQRPVLLLAVYHNADELLRIKPFIESLGLGYAVLLRGLNHAGLLMEATLLAYPAELGASSSQR
jgi:FkbM family methyltransferase